MKLKSLIPIITLLSLLFLSSSIHSTKLIASKVAYNTNLCALNEHPIKITSSEIKYDIKTNSLSMECKVFIDDFAPVISHTLLSRIYSSSLTSDDKMQIEDYFLMKYKIFINNKKLPLKFKSYTIQNNIMSIEFLENSITLKKGDQLHIENKLLFEVYGPMQSNWVTLSMAPFIPNSNLESKFQNYTYSQTL